MAIPPTAVVWPDTMDPYDIVDYVVDVTNLLDGETVLDFSFTPLAESTLMGLRVGTGEYESKVLGNELRVWFSIDPSKQGSPAFDGAGTALPVEMNLTVDSDPVRRRQRTLVVKVAQR